MGYLDFVDLPLEEELGLREGRRSRNALKLSGLPHHKTLDTFEFVGTHSPACNTECTMRTRWRLLYQVRYRTTKLHPDWATHCPVIHAEQSANSLTARFTLLSGFGRHGRRRSDRPSGAAAHAPRP